MNTQQKTYHIYLFLKQRTCNYTVSILVLAIILLILPFNNTIKSQNNTDSTTTNIKNEVYKIGLPNVPGLMYRDKNGMPKGFPVEIIHFILIKEQIKFVWIDGTWNELFTKLKHGEIDLLPGVQITEERKKHIDYVNTPLNTQWSELYINKETNFENIEDLYKQKVALVKGDNNAQGFINYFNKFNIEYQAIVFNSHKKAMDELRAGKIYAMVGPSPNSLGDELEGIKSAGIYFNPTDAGFALAKGKNNKLSVVIENSLKALINKPNSIYYELLSEYDLKSYRNKKWKVPQWVKLLISTAIILVIMSIVFIILLRNRVHKKTHIIKDRENLLRKAMDIGKIGTWVYNYKTDELLWSDEIYEIAGVEKRKGKLLYSEMKKIIHPEDLEKAEIHTNKLVTHNENIEHEYRLIKGNGKVVHIKQIGTIEKDEHGAALRILGVIQNINKQKKHEQELIKEKEKAEKSEKLQSAFLANMSHEIRTPLNSIVGFSSLLAEEEIEKEQKIKFRDIIIKQNDLLLTLINDILDISKIESGNMDIKLKTVNITELVKEVYDSFIHQCPADIKFINKLNNSATNSTIYCDKDRLSQILINFVSNAFKYTKKGEIEIGYTLDKYTDTIKLYVKDTGIGISNQEQTKVFAPFKQIDQMIQGTGLGLSISKSLADLMNMEIAVQSEKGKGSEFFVIVPLSNT